nr:hypothetical protein [Tanacetum cinerariifolium]
KDPVSDFSLFNKWYQSLVRSFDLHKNKISSTAEEENDEEKLNYKLGVDQLEGRLVEYREREVKYIEKIRTLEFYYEGKVKYVETLKKELETLKEEKDVVDGKLARLRKSSKDLEDIIESQRSDKVKEGVGYNVVPPPAADLYRSLKKDLSWTGLPEFADDKVTDYSRPSPTVESTSAEGQNKHSTTTENGESTDSILSKPTVKFVKAGDRPAERPSTNKAEFVKAAERTTTDKVETIKKPVVRYVEMYRRTSKRRRVQRETTRSQNHSYESPYHRSYGAPMRPSNGPAGHRPHGPPMRPMRSNMNVINRRNRVKDVQASACWVWKSVKPNSASIILKRYDYVDVRGRSSFPTSSDVFPLPEEVPTARRKFPLSEEVPTGSAKFASNSESMKDVYSKKQITAVTRLNIMKKYDYGHLDEIEVRKEDQQLYTFKEGDFP